MEYINDTLIKEVAKALSITEAQVKVVLDLLEEGGTVPFIARYRKEVTGSLDEEQIRAISKEYEYGLALEKRKNDVIRLIDEKGLLTEELKKQILEADKLITIEDIYRPFKEKKKTKATEAIKNGLEPLANIMLAFPKTGSLEELAKPFLTENVKTVEDAIQGAKYIIAEKVSDNAKYREWIREKAMLFGTFRTKKKKDATDELGTYQVYYDYSELIRTCKSYRILAMNRAEKEKVITATIDVDQDYYVNFLNNRVIKNPNSFVVEVVKDAIADSFKRLIWPSIEREIWSILTDQAETNAISVFSTNLEHLLLQPPMKGKIVLGVDPAFRTGCKLAVLDVTGKVLEKGVIYQNQKYPDEMVPKTRIMEAKRTVLDLFNRYKVEVVAIGNGTASRETEKFFAELIKEANKQIYFIIVSEAGASVYSASELAKEEFPDYQVEERSAVSIGRRLQDPLSELVKIEPKAIGVGQYQHDVQQNKLVESLDFVVEKTVNRVGVNVNTASKALLQYVAGLNKAIAGNIVKYRDEKGVFKNRDQIKKVPRLGDKAFEQAIGFLRIPDSTNPLDKTGIHPESYFVAAEVLKSLGFGANDLGSAELINKINDVNREKLASDLKISLITLEDILDAFASPTRDPRDECATPLLKSDLLHMEDLRPGMALEGTVRNVLDFGAFIDVGIKESGLVHVSKMAKRKIGHPSELLSVGQIVKVYVIDVDLQRRRLALTLVKPE